MSKEFFTKVWTKISNALLKSFRGLICEKKDGGWELSKGNVAFWIVFGHCLYIWNKIGEVSKEATDVLTADGAEQLMETIVKYSEVSSGELNVLLALLGYAGLKTVKDGVVAWKNGE